MVDWDTYDCVEFLFIWETLDGDGGADLSATARIRNRWIMFQELFPFLISRAPPLEMKRRTYASEARPLLLKFKRCRWVDGCMMCPWKTERKMKDWESWLELSLSQLSLEVVGWDGMSRENTLACLRMRRKFSISLYV